MISNLLFPALIAVALTGLTLWIAVAIRNNVRTGNRFRQELRQRLEDLPLYRMLNARGISPARYLHTKAVPDIENQMRQCAACEQSETCSDDIAADKTENAQHYCPNYDTMTDRG